MGCEVWGVPGIIIISDRGGPGGPLCDKIGYFITKAWRTDRAGTGWVSEIFPNQAAGESD